MRVLQQNSQQSELCLCICNRLDGSPHFTFAFEHRSSLTLWASILFPGAFSSSKHASMEKAEAHFENSGLQRMQGLFSIRQLLYATLVVSRHTKPVQTYSLSRRQLFLVLSHSLQSQGLGALGQIGALAIGFFEQLRLFIPKSCCYLWFSVLLNDLPVGEHFVWKYCE